MFTDIVFPDNNEEEFIELASKLGYDGLFFVYKYNNKEYEEKIRELQKNTKLKLNYGFIISLKEINRIKSKNLILIKNSPKNRFVIEKKKANILFSLEDSVKEDFIHHRASGLNQVLCELAAKNNIIIGFSFNMFIKNKKNLYKIIGRVMQNILLCRKYKIKTIIGSFAEKTFEMKSAKDLSSLFFILGMYKNEIKNGFNLISHLKQ